MKAVLVRKTSSKPRDDEDHVKGWDGSFIVTEAKKPNGVVVNFDVRVCHVALFENATKRDRCCEERVCSPSIPVECVDSTIDHQPRP